MNQVKDKKQRIKRPPRRDRRVKKVTENFSGPAVYVLEFDNGIKIGYSMSLCGRLKSYQSPWCRKIINSAFYSSLTAIELEAVLLKRFKNNIETLGSSEFVTNVPFETITNFIEHNPYYLPPVEKKVGAEVRTAPPKQKKCGRVRRIKFSKKTETKVNPDPNHDPAWD